MSDRVVLEDLFSNATMIRSEGGFWSVLDSETGEHISGVPFNEQVILNALVETRKVVRYQRES